MNKNKKKTLVDNLFHHNKKWGLLSPENCKQISFSLGKWESPFDVAGNLSLALQMQVHPTNNDELVSFIKNHEFHTKEEWLIRGRRITKTKPLLGMRIKGDIKELNIDTIEVYEKSQTRPLVVQKKDRRTNNSFSLTETQKTLIKTSMEMREDKELFLESLETPEGKKSGEKYFQRKMWFQIFSTEHKVVGRVIMEFLREENLVRRKAPKNKPTESRPTKSKPTEATIPTVAKTFEIVNEDDFYKRIKIEDFLGNKFEIIFPKDMLRKL